MKDLSGYWPDLQPATERDSLEQHLDFCRAAAAARLEDLSDDQAATRPLPGSDLTIGGVIKHLAWVEDRWFTGKLLGRSLPEPWRSAPLATQPGWPFESAGDDAAEGLLQLYGEACARSREVACRFESLDGVAAEPSFGMGPVTLRWLYVHMVQETAWHLGHLDLLRGGLGVPPGPE